MWCSAANNAEQLLVLVGSHLVCGLSRAQRCKCCMEPVRVHTCVPTAICMPVETMDTTFLRLHLLMPLGCEHAQTSN